MLGKKKIILKKENSNMKKDVLFGVLVIALIYLVLDKAGIVGENKVKGPDTTIVRDTVWNESTKTIIKEIQQVGGDEGFVPENEDKYVSTSNYDTLLVKFNTLVKELTSRKFYKDSLRLDSVGYIVVSDTVQFNSLQKRSYNYSYKIPHVTETVTITKYAPPVSQLYIGGGFGANNVQAGLLYKTKKDLMIGAYISPPLGQNKMQYGIQSYWKIKLKK